VSITVRANLRRLPAARASWVRPVLLANLIGEGLIVVTGGVVRLTGSGLGCPTWPECVPGSFVPVPHQEQGIHKFIEFGNRTLTGLVGILALLSIWAVVTHWPRRRRMHRLAYGVLGGVVAQAVLGGITVRTGLNPFSVAGHFILSMVLVALSTALVRGAEDTESGPGDLLVHPLARMLGWGTAAMGAIVLVLGTIVTGSGPHSGDAVTPARTGFDPRFVSWMHADAVMFFCGLVIATLVAVRLTAKDGRANRAWNIVLLVTVLQGVIGYVQYFTGLPEVLVLAHMFGATALVVALAYGVLDLRSNPV
jgi:cytochrome c oxidase assembly protein subunit 15